MGWFKRLSMTCWVAAAAVATLASPASAKQYFFCYTEEGYSENPKLLVLSAIMESDVERIDDHRLRMAWMAFDDAITPPSSTGSTSAYCYVTDNRRSIDRYFQEKSPRYTYGEPVKWMTVPSDIVPRPAVIDPNTVEIAVESTTPEPKSQSPAQAQVPSEKTPNQLKYERELAEHQRLLAEHQRLLAEREKAIADAAAKHAANRAAAEAELARHNKELAEHAQKVAQMERDAAAVRAEWAMRAAGADPEQKDDEPVEFKEGVVLCRQPNASSKSSSCQGPLQNTSAVLDAPGMTVALGQACGSDRSIRDLGMVKGYRAFGCGFGIHPTARDYPGNTDVPAKLGIDFIPGRGSYFCPKSKLAYCRG